jgi:hypothetical protein
LKKLAALTAAVGALTLAITTAFAATSFSQGFETDTADWQSVTRVASGTNGVPSADGAFHAEAGSGAFTRFGGYEMAFPSGGYTTSLDFYLDVDAGLANDTRFDWSSAINTPAGAHQRDFVFNAGFYNDSDVTGSGPRFVISASNNAGRANAFPKNPARDPFTITETGWYTFQHSFYSDGGVLAVDLSILDADGNVLHTWTLSDPTDVIGTTVGGHRYGWIVFHELPFLAIDNTSLVSISEPANKDACKKGGWESLTRDDGSAFKNQGDCVQYVNTGK